MSACLYNPQTRTRLLHSSILRTHIPITRRMMHQQTEAKNMKRATMEDRLCNLPESLQLCILSSLDLRHAVQTSILSKSWVSLWTLIPILEFNHLQFHDLHAFDDFVDKVLSLRDPSVKLERFTFTRGGICRANYLKKIFDYAFSQGVKELETWISSATDNHWPLCSHSSWDSLKSLKLHSQRYTGFSLLGPRSRYVTFKNLTDLHLKRVNINDLDPFSGFPALEKLTLINCHVNTNSRTLNIQALQLLSLVMFCYEGVDCCELITPKLRFFEYQGFSFPLFKTQLQQGLPVLEKVVIDLHGVCSNKHEEKILFDDLVRLFSSLYNAKSLTLFWSVVQLLYLFPEKLKNQCSPFRDLKSLKLDFRSPQKQDSIKSFENLSVVKAYLLRKSI